MLTVLHDTKDAHHLFSVLGIHVVKDMDNDDGDFPRRAKQIVLEFPNDELPKRELNTGWVFVMNTDGKTIYRYRLPDEPQK